MKKQKEFSLHASISKLRIKRDLLVKTINKQINKKQAELEKICTHSETQTRDENYEGGYDHTAEYNRITECKICGKELERKTSYGSYA